MSVEREKRKSGVSCKTRSVCMSSLVSLVAVVAQCVRDHREQVRGKCDKRERVCEMMMWCGWLKRQECQCVVIHRILCMFTQSV